MTVVDQALQGKEAEGRRGRAGIVGAARGGVAATAKVDLDAGAILNDIGGYSTDGQAEDAERVLGERLLPIGFAERCRLPEEQDRHFFLDPAPA